MNNVVYIKHFENGKKYVGITNNFKHRMSKHKRDAFTKNSQLPVHRAMRKHNHETEIVFWSEDYDDVLRMEQVIIQNFKDLGVELYNMTDGGQGALGRGMSDMEKNAIREANAKRIWDRDARDKMRKACLYDVGYYSTTPTTRGHFKRYCERAGLNFSDFNEVFAKWKEPTKTTNRRKIYYYILKGDDENDK